MRPTTIRKARLGKDDARRDRPRATGSLDLWVEAAPGNAARVMRALRA